jgi:hypothetical protein
MQPVTVVNSHRKDLEPSALSRPLEDPGTIDPSPAGNPATPSAAAGTRCRKGQATRHHPARHFPYSDFNRPHVVEMIADMPHPSP